MNQAVMISILGMGSVFATILLLWAVMAVLARLTQGKVRRGEVEEKPADLEMIHQAAAAAVAYALAHAAASSQEPHEFPLPATAIVSAWQAVMRTSMLNKRGRLR